MKIVLIGFACSYKTTVGKLLAEKFNLPHVDVDDEIERLANKSVEQIFAHEGEEAFRRMETQALKDAKQTENAVISCGGGAVLSSEFPSLAHGANVVWLKVNAENVNARLGKVARPLFDGKDVSTLAKMINGRISVYAKYADITVDTNGLTSVEVADKVFELLSSR